jgi:imidazolonepropionase-like amidohydrolase
MRMARFTRRILVGVVAAVAILAVAIAWLAWPLWTFLHGEPRWHRLADLGLQDRGTPIVILGGTLVDGNGGPPLENSAILIRDGRIADVGPAADVAIPSGAIRIKAAGKTVLPGLIDMHVHLFKGDDVHLFVAAGVTAVRDVGGFTDRMQALAAGTRSGEILGPRIFYSGESFIHQHGFAQWQRPTKDEADARAEVKKRIAAGASVIKIVSDITPELTEAIVDEAHRAKVPVTADVLGNQVVTAERAIELGVDGLEHVSGVPQAIQADDAPTRSSEAISRNALFAWLYADKRKEDALIALIVERGTYIVPTFAVMEVQLPDGVPVRDDPSASFIGARLRSFWTGVERIPSPSSAADRSFADGFLTHFAYSQAFVSRLDAAGARIVAGTDEPTPGLAPGFSLHRELELLVKAGLTPMRAIQAATRTAADVLGRRDDLGTIARGKLADVIVVDGQPHVRISDIRKVRTVVYNGVPIDPAAVLKLPQRN